MELKDFLERGAEAVEISLADLKGRKRGASIVEGREILAWLGVELYGFAVKEMAKALDKHLETASRLVSRGGRREGSRTRTSGRRSSGWIRSSSGRLKMADEP